MSILLSIDPSLTCTGWAMFGLSSRRLGAYGVVEDAQGPDLIARCRDMVERTVLATRQEAHEANITHVVLELPQTEVHGLPRHAQATLPNYGMIVGYFAAWLNHESGSQDGFGFQPELHPVSVTEWAMRKPTKGDKYKTNRVREVQFKFGIDLTSGRNKLPKSIAGNAADAILLGDWWLNQREAFDRVRKAVHGVKP